MTTKPDPRLVRDGLVHRERCPVLVTGETAHGPCLCPTKWTPSFDPHTVAPADNPDGHRTKTKSFA